MALPCYRPAFGPGVAVGRKAGRLETEQKLPRGGRGGCAEHAGDTGLPTAGVCPLAAAAGLPTASFPGVFGFPLQKRRWHFLLLRAAPGERVRLGIRCCCGA